MVKKIAILCGLFVLLILLWIAVGVWVTSLYGNAGFGGSLLIGFVTVPLILRLAIIKLFKLGGKKLDV